MAVVGWLLVSRNSKPHLALPVPRQALMGLTRAVSFSLQTITEEQSLLQQDRRTSGSWRDRCWRLAASDPTVAIWLASEEKLSWEAGVPLMRIIAPQVRRQPTGLSVWKRVSSRFQALRA